MEAKQLSARDDPRRRAVRRWKNLRGEAKLAWDYLFSVAAGQATTIVVLPADVGSDQGTSDRGGRRALEALAVAGLIEIIDRLAGQWTVYLPDPLDVAKARRARESDDRPTFDFACDGSEIDGQWDRSESSPADGQRGGPGAAVVLPQPPPLHGPPPVSGGGDDRVAGRGDRDVGGSGATTAAADPAPLPPRRTYTLTNGESIENPSTSSPATGPIHVDDARKIIQRAQVPGGSGAGSAADGPKNPVAGSIGAAMAAATASMLARGDNLAERSRLADELAELIVSVLGDANYPPSHAIDVAHAVWIDGDLQAAVVKGLLATISGGVDKKRRPIRTPGAFFRESIRNQATKAAASADRHAREVGEALRRCMARGRSK